MKTEYQYIRFVQLIATGKTPRWSCQNIKNREELGELKWYGPWGQYCYFPTVPAVYNAGCLKDIEDFIAQLKADNQ